MSQQSTQQYIQLLFRMSAMISVAQVNELLQRTKRDELIFAVVENLNQLNVEQIISWIYCQNNVEEKIYRLQSKLTEIAQTIVKQIDDDGIYQISASKLKAITKKQYLNAIRITEQQMEQNFIQQQRKRVFASGTFREINQMSQKTDSNLKRSKNKYHEHPAIGIFQIQKILPGDEAQ